MIPAGKEGVDLVFVVVPFGSTALTGEGIFQIYSWDAFPPFRGKLLSQGTFREYLESEKQSGGITQVFTRGPSEQVAKNR